MALELERLRQVEGPPKRLGPIIEQLSQLNLEDMLQETPSEQAATEAPNVKRNLSHGVAEITGKGLGKDRSC